MAKLLRLDVAQLTDVGRKREHNEDNMAYVIPKDPQVMARKGALFIVADGMGGHAAGEVASEIAVDTVSNAYYQDENDDVTTSLLNAIRRANAAIHQRAAENMLRSGMGTTCVAAVLCGNRAYIANVGDSRAYFIRRSQIRQVSQDHSWVAEQVRAGLLTEEQARTHAQRNVITRSLGTQPEVEVDIFSELLEEGDSLVLCSDGLSGQVNDDELLRTVDQFVPQESVYHLVERANENGGPDNITAIVVRVQEVGAEAPSVRQPVPVGGPELSNEDTARIFAPVGAGSTTTRNGEMPVPGSPFPYNNGPLASADHDTAPQPALKTKRRHGRLFYPTLALLILLALVIAGGGGYYFLHVNQAQTIKQTLNDAGSLVSQASRETSHSPAQALRDLSSAQQKLRNLQANYTLNASDNTQLTSLQNQIVTGAKSAITLYNQQAQIALLPCPNSTPSSLSQGTVSTLALITGNSSTLYYALGQDGKIYQLQNNSNQYTLSGGIALPNNARVASMASSRNQIFALSQPGDATASGNYAINTLSSGQHGLQPGKTQNLAAQDGQTPYLITAWNDGSNAATTSLYVVLASTSNTNSATIVNYNVDGKNGNFSGAISSPISVSERILSITATADRLYMLQADGSILSSQINNGHIATPSPVLVNQPIALPLAASAQGFDTKSTVPAPTPITQKGNTPLTIPLSSNNPPLLSSGMVTDAAGNAQFHLFAGDPVNHRVLDLTLAAGGPDASPTNSAQGGSLALVLSQQYVSPGYFNSIKSVTVDPGGTAILVLGQRAPANENLVVVNAGNSQTCAS